MNRIMGQMVIMGLIFTIIGYMLGSILFAQLCAEKIKHIDLAQCGTDGNPGTANAFKEAGFLCGVLALLGDLGKGIVPVYGYMHFVTVRGYAIPHAPLMLIPVMIAPVLGHAFSVFHHFKGGKCIAVSFGVFLGLFPYMTPVLTLAVIYIALILLRIKSHDKCTVLAFILTGIADLLLLQEKTVIAATWCIVYIVIRKQMIFRKKTISAVYSE